MWQNQTKIKNFAISVILISVFMISVCSLSYGLPSVKTSSSEVNREWTFETDDAILEDIALSDDGKYIIAVGRNASTSDFEGRYFFFGASSSTPEWSYNASSIGIEAAISQDGKYFVVGDHDNCTYLFNRTQNMPLWSHDAKYMVGNVAMCANGTYFASGSDNGTVYYFSKESSTPQWVYQIGEDIQSMAMSPDGEYLVVGARYKGIYLFQRSNPTPLWINETNVYGPHYVDISADGQTIVVGYDGNLSVFGLSSNNPVSINSDNSMDINNIDISSEGNYITMTNAIQELFLFDSQAKLIFSYGGTSKKSSITANGGYITSISLSGVQMYCPSSQNTLWYFNDVGDHNSQDLQITSDAERIVFLTRNPTEYVSAIHYFSHTITEDEQDKKNNENENEVPTVSIGIIFLLFASAGICLLTIKERRKLNS